MVRTSLLKAFKYGVWAELLKTAGCWFKDVKLMLSTVSRDWFKINQRSNMDF